jgi:hypothetical protein
LCIRPAATFERLEERRLFTLDQDGMPVGPAFKYTDAPPGWHVTLDANESRAYLTLTGPDTDDVVRVTRSPTLQTGVDLDINGRKMTINFVHADAIFTMAWNIESGGGNDRVELALGMGDSFAAGCRIDGGDGDDVLISGDVGNQLYGGAGDDVLIGGRGADMLQGDGGIDRLYGGAGEDTLMPGQDPSPGRYGYGAVEPGEIYDGGPGYDRLIAYQIARIEPQITELPELDPAPELPVEVSPPPHDPRLPFTRPPDGMSVNYKLDGDHGGRLYVDGTHGGDVLHIRRKRNYPPRSTSR